MTRLWACQSWVQILVVARNFSFLWDFQPGSGPHLAVYKIGSGGSVLEVWGMRQTIHFHLVLRFSMSGVLPVLPTVCLNGMHKAFFFNRHCNPCGFWPAQLSLSILSRKVITECRCQWHVKPPTWRTSDLERSTLRHKVSPASETTQANPSSGRWNYGREIAENFAKSGDFHVTFGFFYMP